MAKRKIWKKEKSNKESTPDDAYTMFGEDLSAISSTGAKDKMVHFLQFIRHYQIYTLQVPNWI
jgi:hypothetical protein